MVESVRIAISPENNSRCGSCKWWIRGGPIETYYCRLFSTILESKLTKPSAVITRAVACVENAAKSVSLNTEDIL